MDEQTRAPAEVFPPSEFLRMELDARGWSVATLAEESMLTTARVEELLAGYARITPLMSLCLGRAFGTGPEVWENLQRQWDERRP